MNNERLRKETKMNAAKKEVFSQIDLGKHIESYLLRGISMKLFYTYRVSLLLIIVFVCLFADTSLGFEFAGGTGEPNDPYKIETATQLISIGLDPNMLSRHFILIEDINLVNLPDRNRFYDAVIPGQVTWEYISGLPARPVANNVFSGSFNGSGHIIRNMRITSDGIDGIGLFGALDQGAVVMNLGIEGINIHSTGSCIGSLVGYNMGTIVSCYSKGAKVRGDKYVGGLVGYNSGNLVNCYSNYSNGEEVQGNRYVGGLVGNNNGSISNSYAVGAAIREEVSRSASGLVGGNSGSITNSFWNTDFINTSTSSFCGIGLPTSKMKDINTYRAVGWDLRGEPNDGTCEFWDCDPNQYPQLSVFDDYLPNTLEGEGTPEFPYIIYDANDLGSVWYRPMAYYQLGTHIDLNDISWTTAIVGWFGGQFDGNDLNVYNMSIKGGGHLGLFGILGHEAKITRLGIENISVEGAGLCIGGLVGFNYSGNLINNYCTGMVSGDSVMQDFYIGGLVGYNSLGYIADCCHTGTVSNGGSLSQRDNYIGGLVGYNDLGDIMNCYNIGEVSGLGAVGGLVGYNGGSITSSYSSCDSICKVNGSSYVGGLIGESHGSVANCYSNTEVNGDISVGGLVGECYGSVDNCYSTGDVNGITFCIGGLIGNSFGGSVANCYSTSDVKGSSSSMGVGGLIGNCSANNVENCYSIGRINGGVGVG
ncbi:GLUG motif-containing protein, partial [Planctomycetota bacterium]